MNVATKKRRHISVAQLILAIVVIFFLFLTLYPLLIMLIKSVKSPQQELLSPNWITFPFRWENYSEAWYYIDYTFANTFIISFGTTALLLVVSSMASYGITRYRIPFKGAIVVMFLAVMMIPGVLTLIPQYQLVSVSYNLQSNYLGVILPTAAGAVPMAVFLIRTFFDGLPGDIFEAGVIDGCSNLRMYFCIALPLSLPILATQGLLTFMASYNDYLWPLLILRAENMKTTSVILKSLTDTLYNETNSMNVAIAGYVLASLPMIILYAFCSKQFVKGLTSGSFKM